MGGLWFAELLGTDMQKAPSRHRDTTDILQVNQISLKAPAAKFQHSVLSGDAERLSGSQIPQLPATLTWADKTVQTKKLKYFIDPVNDWISILRVVLIAFMIFFLLPL